MSNRFVAFVRSGDWAPIGRFAVCMALAFFGLAPARVLAADLPTVNYDLETGAFDGVLPHRTDFMVRVEVPRAYNRVTLKYWDADGALQCKAPPKTAKPAWGVNRDSLDDTVTVRTVEVKVPALEFSRAYCFAAELGRDWSPADGVALSDGLNDVLSTLLTSGAVTPDDILAAVRAHIPDAKGLTISETGKATPQPLDDYLARWLMAQLTGKQIAELMSQLDTDLKNVDSRRAHLSFDKVTGELLAPPAPAPARSPGAGPAGTPAAAPPLADLQTAFEALRAASNKLGPLAFDVEDFRANPTRFDELLGAVRGFMAAYDTNPPTLACPGVPPRWASTCGARLWASQLVAAVYQVAATNAALSRALDAQKRENVNVVGSLRKAVRVGATSTSTSAPSYTQRSIFYMAGDVGAVLPLFFHKGKKTDADYALYAGVSFYFVPVDKDKPLSAEDGIWHRLSLNAGVTLNDIKDPSHSARGVLDGKGAMVGAGFRLTDYLRLSAGAMLIRQKRDNPLSTEEALRLTPYLSASVDVDVAGTVSGWFKKPGSMD